MCLSSLRQGLHGKILFSINKMTEVLKIISKKHKLFSAFVLGKW